MNTKTFLSLFRVLFPKWNFFDQIAYSIELEFKVPGATQWSPVSFQQPRRGFSLFLNSQTNLALAHMNILEHFAEDIQSLQMKDTLIDSAAVQILPTYKMLVALLSLKLREFELPSRTIQFKIIAKNPSHIVDVYISDWIQIQVEEEI